jgi:hypothetical protein
LRAEERRALFLPEDFARELLRAPLRAELRPARLADFPVLFFADFRADFFARFREEAPLAEPRLDFLADLRRGRAGRSRVPEEESSRLLYEAGVEAGVGGGVFSIGNGSIQPEPDQPISI